MQRGALFAVLVSWTALLAGPARAGGDHPDPGHVCMTGSYGRVEILRQGSRTWKRARFHEDLDGGDRLRTGRRAFAHLAFWSGERRSLEAKSQAYFPRGSKWDRPEGAVVERGRLAQARFDARAAAHRGEYHETFACVTRVSGRAFVRIDGVWHRIRGHVDLFPGMELRTAPGSFAHVTYWNGDKRCVDADSRVTLRESDFTRSARDFVVLKGKITHRNRA